MGLIQNIASLAQPTANTIRPTDILTAGQQGQQQIQAGLTGAVNMMANERKQTAQDRADQAVAGLLSKAPSGTQDPTQFNQALGLVSSYGSQGMKDAARNAITSATEGYRTGLQQENFGKTFGLEQNKFDFDKEHKGKLLDLENKKLAVDEAYKNGSLGLQQAQLQISKLNAQQNILNNQFEKQIKVASLKNQGYDYNDKTGKLLYNPDSPKYIASLDASFITDYNKTKPDMNQFKENASNRNLFGSWATFDDRFYNAYGQANKFLLTPTTSKSGLAAKQQVKSLLEAGDYKSLETLLSKYK